jgi:hypothetical protein
LFRPGLGHVKRLAVEIVVDGKRCVRNDHCEFP